jgi:hypothetical protein
MEGLKRESRIPEIRGSGNRKEGGPRLGSAGLADSSCSLRDRAISGFPDLRIPLPATLTPPVAGSILSGENPVAQNLGKVDRILRSGIGLALFGVGLFFQSWWGALGVVPLLTALNGFCPLYRILGLDTLRGRAPEGG